MARTEAALYLAVTYDRDRDGPMGHDRALGSCMDIYRICGAIQNLRLAAGAQGLGVVWIRHADREPSRGCWHCPRGAAHRLSQPRHSLDIRRAAQTGSGGLARSKTCRCRRLHGPLGADRGTSCGVHTPN
jgi:hypothetical protein